MDKLYKLQDEIDLEQEVLDAQKAFDDDWYALSMDMKHITQSYQNWQMWEKKLKEYKQNNV